MSGQQNGEITECHGHMSRYVRLTVLDSCQDKYVYCKYSKLPDYDYRNDIGNFTGLIALEVSDWLKLEEIAWENPWLLKLKGQYENYYISIILSQILSFICDEGKFCLTHWPLGDVAKIVIFFLIHVTYSNFVYFEWDCSHLDATGLYWWQVNIGSGNGLVPSGNQPLSEAMLPQIHVTIRCH